VSNPASCCYGKIPTLGDFIHRGLSQRQIDVWDEWLQDCMVESRHRLGEGWLDFYLEAPVWYFALGSGNLDQQSWIGVMIPSVDRVGRYFPFAVMRPFTGGTPLDAMRLARDWFSKAETLTLDCLEEGFDAGGLESRLAALPEERSTTAALSSAALASEPDSAGRLYLLGQAPSTNNVLSTIADDCLLQLHPTYSVWWTAGSSAVEASLLITSGLPASAAFSSMLDGRFADGGWSGYRQIPSAPGVDQGSFDAEHGAAGA
jgi:type VI secretion system protein ImpM